MVGDSNDTPPLIVVSGLSGSGKTVVLRTLEDLDYYCVDNLPAELLPDFVRSVRDGDSSHPRMAVGIDVRNRLRDLDHLPTSLSAVGALGIDYRLIFLDTRDEVLIKRYSDTRRRHPMSQQGQPLARAIAEERSRLGPLRALAGNVLDSSDMNVHQLRRWVVTDLAAGADDGLSLLIQSFAYRRGVPPDADFVFDARCLPNPHWEPSLRPLSGRDAEVRDWLLRQDRVSEYASGVTAFLDAWLPRFAAETRSYLTIAFGCTGGRHRSVFLAEALAEHCRKKAYGTVVSFHRELE
ncbi:MAG: RNase adapter RapZ [Xanthomonadales bacterium]|nr:RNase adapter RapZ [Xanthomonadales bacterium]